MIDLIIVGIGVAIMSRIVKAKGIKGPFPYIFTIISFPIGMLIGFYFLFQLREIEMLEYGEFTYSQILATPILLIPHITGLALLIFTLLFYSYKSLDQKLGPVNYKYKWLYVFFFYLLAGLCFVLGFNLYTAYPGAGSNIINNFLVFMLFVLGGQCFRLGRKATKLNARSNVFEIANDNFYLFLRSFSADKKYKRIATYSVGGTNVSFEEDLYKKMKSSKIVALGDPQDFFPELGSERFYSDYESWFEKFKTLVSKASAVLIVPDNSQGLQDEINYLLTQLEKKIDIYLLVPSDYYSFDPMKIWPEFVEKLAGMSIELPATIEAGTILKLYPDQPYQIIGKNLHEGVDFVEAIERNAKGQDQMFIGKSKQKATFNLGYEIGRGIGGLFNAFLPKKK